jgi:hypothetical protein
MTQRSACLGQQARKSENDTASGQIRIYHYVIESAAVKLWRSSASPSQDKKDHTHHQE